MTREEAIEVYNGLINEKIKAAFEFFAPELRENEDERIRKWLYDYFAAIGEENWIHDKFTRTQILVWLEKQKEQKPAEWSDEDEKIAKEIEEELWYPGDFPDYPSKEESELYDDCQRRLDWFKNKLKSIRPQKPAEWSEEEKGILLECVSALQNSSHWLLADKLKSLRPQPKHEWSEDEKKLLNSIIDDYEKASKSFCGYDGKILLLKAIRDGEYGLSKQDLERIERYRGK